MRRLSSFGAHVLRHRHFSFVSSCPSFLNLTLRFWNHILTCFSDRLRYVAISILLSLDRYMLELNSRSSSNSCVLVNAVLILLLLKSSVELLTPTIKKKEKRKKHIDIHVPSVLSMREATPNGSRLYAHAHHESHAYFTSFTQYAKVVYSLYSCFAIYRFIHVRPVKRSMLSTRNKMQWNSKMLGFFTDKTMKISPDVHSRGR